jgi:hypothetical protein
MRIEPFCCVDKCLNDGANLIMGNWYCHDHKIQPGEDAMRDLVATGDSFDDFAAGVRELIEGRAQEKGYNKGGSSKNDLMEFTNKFFPGHAGGEIVYKAIRYSRKGDKTDLSKIAAWAYLLWKFGE